MLFRSEINTSCKEDPENPAKPLTKEQMMKNLLNDITAPGGGGTGENWCYTNSSGKETCVFTHHATSDCSVETYIWCDGGNCYTTSLGKTGCKPAGWTCPLDPGGSGQVCGGEIDATQDPNA